MYCRNKFLIAVSCTHFRHPTDEQLGHVDIFFSNYYNLQSVYFELNAMWQCILDLVPQKILNHIERKLKISTRAKTLRKLIETKSEPFNYLV